MKKILSFILMISVCTIAANNLKAQAVPAPISFTGASSSTVKTTLTNTDTAIGKFVLLGNNDYVTIEANVNKVSGTIGGTLYLQGSLSGTSWNTLDSLVTSNQALNSKWFKQSPSYYYFYRIYYATSTTQVSTINASYVTRRIYKQ